MILQKSLLCLHFHCLFGEEAIGEISVIFFFLKCANFSDTVSPPTSLIYVISGYILNFCRFSDVFLTLHSVSQTDFLSFPANKRDFMAPQNYKTLIVQNDVKKMM